MSNNNNNIWPPRRRVRVTEPETEHENQPEPVPVQEPTEKTAVAAQTYIRESNFKNAEKKSGLKDCDGDDESFHEVGVMLSSEIVSGRKHIPRHLLRDMVDHGYVCVLLDKAAVGGLFVACCMINRVGIVDRPYHSRMVNVVFEGAKDLDSADAVVVNYILADGDLDKGTEVRCKDALDQ